LKNVSASLTPLKVHRKQNAEKNPTLNTNDNEPLNTENAKHLKQQSSKHNQWLQEFLKLPISTNQQYSVNNV